MKNLNQHAASIVEVQKDLDLVRQTLADISANDKTQIERMATIEEAILDNPEKALKLFVLQRDVEELSREVRDANDTIGLLFTLMMTLFGGLIISIAALVLNTYFQQRRLAPPMRQQDNDHERG